jgi:hypothetical protein
MWYIYDKICRPVCKKTFEERNYSKFGINPLVETAFRVTGEQHLAGCGSRLLFKLAKYPLRMTMANDIFTVKSTKISVFNCLVVK